MITSGRLFGFGDVMNVTDFRESLKQQFPPNDLSVPLTALWWDAKGEWAQAHDLVDEFETQQGMAVHAYLHRKEGSASNSDYWYTRAGRVFHRPSLEAEWEALVAGLLTAS
jgi:hypothetical protein